MKKFIVLYHSSPEAMEKMANSSPEDMQKGMEPWMVWAEKCGDGLVDMGAPLSGGMKVAPDGVEKSAKDVVGYSILQAENMDDAVNMLKEHPHLSWAEGCEIEVHESMPLPK